MIASFLMHLSSFKETAPKNDPILTHVYQCARECGIARQELEEWGRLVKARVQAQNNAVQLSDGVDEAVAEALRMSAEHVVTTQEATNSRLASMAKTIEKMDRNLSW